MSQDKVIFVESLSDEEVRAQVLSSVDRMDAAHREQLALYLGADRGEEHDVRVLVESCPLLRERYAAFLHDNPDALEAFAPAPPRRNRLLPFAIAAAAILLAIVPLVAQYENQQGLVSGPNVAMAPLPAVFRPEKPVVAARLHPVRHALAQRRPPAAVRRAAAQSAPAARRVASLRQPRVIRKAQRRPRRRHVDVALWQFSPQNNPYVSHIRGRIAAQPDGAAKRARSVVDNYLNQVIHGDIFSAPEASIVSPMSNTQVISVRPAANGQEKVDVAISGPRGHYYEVFYVARNSMQIVNQFYVRER